MQPTPHIDEDIAQDMARGRPLPARIALKRNGTMSLRKIDRLIVLAAACLALGCLSLLVALVTF